jgi:cysteine desulfurase / selenocysteine lyase
MNWSTVRREFPALQNWTYLNTATFGQVPRRGADAVAKHFAHRDELACSDFLDWFSDADRLRGTIARLINASADDIAFVPNAASALATVIAGLNLAPEDNIVTLDDEFPNYLYAGAARRVQWELLRESVDARTRLVAFSEVNYALGFRPSLAEISPFLAERGVPLFIDGSQSTGALVFDVQRTPVDVLAVHAYKWMISPPGAAFMYVSPRFRAKLPPNVIGWKSHWNWRNVDNLHQGSPELPESAMKYEGGGLAIPLLYAMEASIELLLEIGPKTVEQRVLELGADARTRLRRLGAVIEDDDSPIVAARFPGRDPSPIAKELERRRVVVAARHGRLRVSPHFYNNESDLDRLETELRSLL